MKTRNEKPISLNLLKGGALVDIRALERLIEKNHMSIILYFEEEVANAGGYAENLQEFIDVPEEGRPFISLPYFLQFQREMNPLFDEALATIPLMITILDVSEYEGLPLVRGLLPFLDEMEM